MRLRFVGAAFALLVLAGFSVWGCPDEGGCSIDGDCPPGRYCQAGTCSFDCVQDPECPADFFCSQNGRCERGCRQTHNGVEVCDGLDNDCDGQTDEEWPDLGQPCRNGTCPEGNWICNRDLDGVVCDGPLPLVDDTACDGLDGDCDGQTDEDAIEQFCPLQEGVCAGKLSACQVGGGWSECDYGPTFTADLDETCDGVDNDCDGATDEDSPTVLQAEDGPQATDGLDNNCNGLVDEPGGVMIAIDLVDGVWIDAFEIRVYDAADCSGVAYGLAGDDYPPGWPAGDSATEVLYACSLPGVVPSGYLSWYRSLRACQAQGKRLCSRLEWGSACRGEANQLYPYGNVFLPGMCNDAWAGAGQAAGSGTYSDCHTDSGVYDQSGNLAEWLQDWVTNPGFPGNAYTAGFQYECELCNHGQYCWPCSDEADPLDRVEYYSDCMTEGSFSESYPRTDARPYLGSRCCYDGS